MTTIRLLAPTGFLGGGFGLGALERGMGMQPDAIAVDAGSTDPGPSFLGTGLPMMSNRIIKNELAALIVAARKAGIPFIIGSAGGAGTNAGVDNVVSMVKEVAKESKLHFKLAKIYSDIPKERVVAAIKACEIRDFEAGAQLRIEDVQASTGLVGQMGDEPFREALDQGADVIVAGRSCDDSAIAAFAIWKGADPSLAIHMGKILECGAISAEPGAMDVMIGTIEGSAFVLEPGSLARRASVKSVAAHTLYEREDPFVQNGPGRVADMRECRFEQLDERRVRVTGTRGHRTDDYWIKLEGSKPVGYRSFALAGVRCPVTIRNLDSVLPQLEKMTREKIADPSLRIVFAKYGANGVMGALEVNKSVPHEIGLVLETTADTQDVAYDAAVTLAGKLNHAMFDGVKNTAGSVAYRYSPRIHNIGLQYEFSVYHLMKVTSPLECFPIVIEEV
ncbi:acyclic terpene utilization AtuA family protein [Bradyrhizobium acaciae]|uniref:acyclic terpene utilization AtuA family protein n=1 Tax=Bradyrhizobium acaciae TaxID=2683706 RepID=UPI001E41107B|nr:acyclic terpene utilization AtuA family protein [Bradyrhizobium acaciae]MCC8982873.1 acyclic terpene utilization AtuA family protein [Bradyrhizobium acaciae]